MTEIPTFRTRLEVVKKREKDGTPWMDTVEIVTEGGDLFGDHPDSILGWQNQTDEVREWWAEHIEAKHDFDVRLAAQEPEVRDAFELRRREANFNYDDLSTIHDELTGLLDEILKACNCGASDASDHRVPFTAASLRP
jgi:hypothetical protein